MNILFLLLRIQEEVQPSDPPGAGLVVLLYCVGLVLVMAEALMMGVVLGLLGIAMLITSIIFGFQNSTLFGGLQLAVAVVFVPAIFLWGIKRLSLKSSLEGVTSVAHDFSTMVGKMGKALTPLRPAGIVLIEGKKYDVVTEGEMVDKGMEVHVIHVEGSKVVVKAR